MDACNERWTRRLSPWHVRKIGELSDASLGSPIQVVDCSREFPMGPSSFARAFKVIFCTTVARYIRLRRIQHVQRLMLLSNERISQIALARGFADQSHDTLAFHKTIVPRSETSAEVASGAVFTGGRVFSLGPLQLFPSQRLLLEDDRRVRIGSRVFDILTVLVVDAGEVVRNDESIERVWPKYSSTTAIPRRSSACFAVPWPKAMRPAVHCYGARARLQLCRAGEFESLRIGEAAAVATAGTHSWSQV